jgi:hypothetical protein
VIEWYEIVEVAIAAAAGVLCVILGLFGSKPGDLSMGSVVLVELLLLGQLGVAIAQPFVGNQPTGSIVEFYIYVIVAILIPLLAGVWALVERDRWSTVVLGVACLAIAVMVVRMNIIWTGHIA